MLQKIKAALDLYDQKRTLGSDELPAIVYLKNFYKEQSKTPSKRRACAS